MRRELFVGYEFFGDINTTHNKFSKLGRKVARSLLNELSKVSPK